METLVYKLPMPTAPPTIWSELISFVRDNAVPGGLFALLWRTIDKLAMHFAEKRRIEMKELIHDEVNPKIEQLSEKIEKLGDAITLLKDKIK